MSIVESYGGSENGAGVHNMHGGAGMYMPVMQNSPPQMAAPISAYPGVGGTEGSTVGAVGEKRKRGRPRKYPVDGSGQKTVSDSPAAVTANGKRRGRPPGSGNKKSNASVGAPTVGLTPHIITVQAGEDVSSRIMSLSQNGGSQAVCILSANGAISNVTLRQASSSGGTVTYEGRFEILTLSGSYMVLESGGQRSRTGGLSVLLAGSDGRVLGGGVAGLLIAATPVQVVLVGFSVGQEPKSPNQTDYSAGPQKPILGSPTSRGTASESSGSPINRSNGNPNNMGMMQEWK